jgi:hypothetical protein
LTLALTRWQLRTVSPRCIDHIVGIAAVHLRGAGRARAAGFSIRKPGKLQEDAGGER